MLDKRTYLILKQIDELCVDGSYKVIECDELVQLMPAKLKATPDAIRQIVKFLTEREYISVKYSDESTYCLAPLPKGRQYFEEADNERERQHTTAQAAFKFAFLGGLVGAVIGGALVLLISILI